MDMTIIIVIVILINMVALSSCTSNCQLSEFTCNNGQCVSSNKYCNSVNDCNDKSDEPRYCTPCNRTYYGDLGSTYEMEIHRPTVAQLPFVCSLTFNAAGGKFGDLVQITFSRFTLGQFKSFTGSNGCLDGEMQISELERPFVGGSWCGTSLKPTNYFSETSSVKMTIKLRQLPLGNNDYNYDIKLTYKVMKRKDAIVRYGIKNGVNEVDNDNSDIKKDEQTNTYFLGELISGTYCSRIFSDCDNKPCRLQSPNFPGMYPRNLTCYYAIRQHVVPTGKHAMIGIKQSFGKMLSIQSIKYLENHYETSLKFWHECDLVQDYVTVYDGYTTRDPILLKFCGGGTALPEIISSGPELLVEFSSSSYGTMLNPTTQLPLHGFHLEVSVHFIQRTSWAYSHNKRCEFWIQGSTNGVLESPFHTLAPNTTCFYHLQGYEPGATPPIKYQESARSRAYFRYKVWLSVLKFYVGPYYNNDPSLKDSSNCSTKLQIWNANVKMDNTCNENNKCKSEITNTSENMQRLLATYCRNVLPKTCEHLTGWPNSRPCSLSESFLSTKNFLTLQLTVTESTALRPISFRTLYEFVDLHQDGEKWETGPCSRRFLSRTQQNNIKSFTFATPKEVFLYGRGGSANLTCIFRFEAQKGEKVKINIKKLHFGNRTNCTTRLNSDSGLTQCLGNATAYILFTEYPYGNKMLSLPKNCLCSESEAFLPFTYISTTQVVHVQFTINNMGFKEDYRQHFMEGQYEFVRSPLCTRTNIVSGTSGEIRLRSPSKTVAEVNCEGEPWMIVPTPKHYLYVKLFGVAIPQSDSIISNVTSFVHCATRNRIVVHTSKSVHLVICPFPVPSERHHIVEIFSDGWVEGTNLPLHYSAPDNLDETESPEYRNVIIEFIPYESGSYQVTWLEISKPGYNMLAAGWATRDECFYRCPQLNGCINSTLWCDGIEHCPSGYDESILNCFFLLRMPALYVIIIITSFSLLLCSGLIIGYRSYKYVSFETASCDTVAIVGSKDNIIC